MQARYLHLKNGDYVPDNSPNFRHGQSARMSLDETVDHLEAIINADTGLETVLVFHNVRADLSIMSCLKVKYAESVPIYDTRELFAARQNSPKGNYTSLSRMLDILDILAFCLHNAGNVRHRKVSYEATADCGRTLMQHCKRFLRCAMSRRYND